MNEKDAINELKQLISEIDNLEDSTRYSAEHTKWVTDTLYYLEDVFGRQSRLYGTFSRFTWQPTGSFITRGYEPQDEIEEWKHQGYLISLQSAKGILQSGIDLIKKRGIENVFDGKDTPKESSEILKILTIIENKLRKLIRDTPKNEKEVQDALENLFIGANLEEDFSREKEHILYSSKTYIPDFVFKKIDTIVEVKFCNSQKKLKEIIDEINADIVAYKTKYANLIFIVYDLGVIREVDEFKNSIESNENVFLKVIKH